MHELIETHLVQPLAGIPYASLVIGLLVLAFVAWVFNWITRGVLLVFVGRLAKASRSQWDDVLIGHRVLACLANVMPALIVLGGIALVPGVPDWFDSAVRNVALAYIALTVAMAIGNLLDALNDIYEKNSRHAMRRPIQGYLQLVKIGVCIVAGVLIIAAVIGKSPLVLLTGLGAMTAVLLLVFKGT